MKQVVSRRRFLSAVAGAGAALMVGDARQLPELVGLSHAELFTAALHSEMRTLFSNAESARAIGAAYLELHPEEHRVGALVGLLVPDQLAQAAYVSPAALKQLFRDSIQRDFESDAIVQINGWVLSRTEARLCAISTLL